MNEKIDDGRWLVRREVDVSGVSSYLDIPMASSRVEADALLEALRLIQEKGSGVGEPNRSRGLPHTRNPTAAQIQAMRRRGLRL
jgi:methionyl-tRNA formyltransferase